MAHYTTSYHTSIPVTGAGAAGSSGNITLNGGTGYTTITPSMSISAAGALGVGAGTPYQIYTTGASSASWVNSNNTNITLPSNGDIKFGERSLMETLNKLADRLAYLVPNPKLEAEFEEMRLLRERYEELEKKCSEQIKAWDILKRDDK